MKLRYEIRDRQHPKWRGQRFTNLDRARRELATGILVAGLVAGCAANGYPSPGGTPADRPPAFDCQEDELMVWRDAPKTAVCVNEDEYVHAAAARAGWVPAGPGDRHLFPLLPR